MITSQRIRDLRLMAGLRQEDMAFLLGVGIASINRWERPGNTLPTGLPREIYEVLNGLAEQGVSLAGIAQRLRAEGSLSTVRWLLNTYHDRRPQESA